MYQRTIDGHEMILGLPGCGKTYAAKAEIRKILEEHPGDRVILMTSSEDYTDLAKEENASTLTIGGGKYYNPMDLNYSEFRFFTPIEEKRNFIISFMQAFVGKELTRIECAAIEHAMYVIHRKTKSTNHKTTPQIKDLYAALISDDHPESKSAALAIESLLDSDFDKQTSIKLNKDPALKDQRLIALQETHSNAALSLLRLEMLWNSITSPDRDMSQKWHIFIDEGSQFIKTRYFQSIHFLAKQRNIAFTIITQDFKELMSDRYGVSVLGNTQHYVLLTQSWENIEQIKKAFWLAKEQYEHLHTNTVGQGLFISGKNINDIVLSEYSSDENYYIEL